MNQARLEHAACVEKATSLPPRLYSDPGQYDAEVAHVFRREWHSVARIDELATPGDYVCVDLFGDPIVIVRDADGSVRAMSRVCRHRGMPIVEGCGNANGFTCPYHRWTYGLDGALRGAPAMERSAGFDRSVHALPALRAEVWQGWVFVNLDPNAVPLAPRLAALAALLEPHALADMRVATTLHYASPWNWKLMVENFMESYHHIGVHAATLQPTHPAFSTHVEDLAGPFVLLENPGKTPEVPPFWAGCVFPFHMFGLTRGSRPFCTWYRMQIRSHAYFDLDIKILVPPAIADKPDAARALAATIDRIHREDIVVCEGVQRGLRASLAAPGRMSYLEKGNWLFHEYLIERLKGEMAP